MKYLMIDAQLGGTGIWDEMEREFILPETLNLSNSIIEELKSWKESYILEFYKGYSDCDIIDVIDREGISIAKRIQLELRDTKISYYSDAKLLKSIYPLI